MNYIGSKYKLLPFIHETIHEVVGEDLTDKVLCDIFAGTGIVGRSFKTKVKCIISNDIELYSYVLNRNYIGNHKDIPLSDDYIQRLNALPLREDGFIFTNYCIGGHGERQYFSDFNGKKIDAMRTQIEEWRDKIEISDDLYYFLLASLLECADKIANTASVYGAYLKHLKKSAQKELVLEAASFDKSSDEHIVYQEDANVLIEQISGDILYLDPPYNARQYGANYHLLNTIAEYKTFTPKGKTGMRDYAKSKYCSRREVKEQFEHLISKANFKYLFLSYNNEGLMSVDDIQSVMEKYGIYSLKTQLYQRFKADKTENRNHKADATIEYLHILEKR